MSPWSFKQKLKKSCLPSSDIQDVGQGQSERRKKIVARQIKNPVDFLSWIRSKGIPGQTGTNLLAENNGRNTSAQNNQR
jgi:hypothetical protein